MSFREKTTSKSVRTRSLPSLTGMTTTANPDLPELDSITMRRLRIMSSLSVAIFGLIGLGFFILCRGGKNISDTAQHRQNMILGISGIALLAGGILLLVLTFWRSSRTLEVA